MKADGAAPARIADLADQALPDQTLSDQTLLIGGRTLCHPGCEAG